MLGDLKFPRVRTTYHNHRAQAEHQHAENGRGHLQVAVKVTGLCAGRFARWRVAAPCTGAPQGFFTERIRLRVVGTKFGPEKVPRRTVINPPSCFAPN